MNHDPHFPPHPQVPALRPRRPRRAVWIAALAVLALTCVVLAVTLHGDDTTTGGAGQASAEPDRSLQPPDYPSPPTTAPPGVRWESMNGILLPFSDTAGPTTVEGPIAAGYEHSPTGALIAGVQITIRKLFTPGAGWRDVAQEQIVPGPGRDVFVESRGQLGDGPVIVTDQVGQIAGFRFVTATPDIAVIQVVSRFQSGRLQVTSLSMRWDGDDWRQELQDDGSASPTAFTVADLSGFVPWAGA